jgi:pyridoxal phosphate enzyme (YggS family)
MSIATQLADIQQQIELALAQRPQTHAIQNKVTLIAVSKAKPASDLRAAFVAGQHAFGENYLQEALNKQQELSDLAIEWHFIGPIQSNKTQAIAQHFAWVHGVDRLKIAQRLNDARADIASPLNICLQVNISGEDSKSGIAPEDLLALAEAVVALPKLKLRGLMAIPDPSLSEPELRQQYADMRRLLQQLQQTLPAHSATLDTLSMGMSNDYTVAIQEGATMVRIGSAIFGARIKASDGNAITHQENNPA